MQPQQAPRFTPRIAPGPSLPDSPRQQAEAAELRGDFASSAALWARVVAEWPRDSYAQYRLGHALFNSAQWGEAGRALRRCLAAGVDFWEPLRLLGLLAQGTGRPWQAAGFYRRSYSARQAGSEPVGLSCLGFGTLGWLDRAAAVLRHAAGEQGPWWDRLRRQSAEALARRRAAALDLLRRRDSLTPAEQLDLAEGLLQLGRLRVAARLLALPALAETPRGLVLRLRLALRESGAAAAAEMAAPLPARHKQDAALAVQAASLCFEADRPDAALALLAALPEPRHNDASRILRCNIHLAGEDAASLMALLRDWAPKKSGATLVHRYALAAGLIGGQLPLLREDGGDPAPPPLPLMQYWDSPTPPEEVLATCRGWQQAMPAHPHRLFHAGSARDFLERHFGAEAVAAFDLCRHPAQQSDLFRLHFLLVQGGCYLDVDEACLRPLTPLLAPLARTELVLVIDDKLPPYAHNLFLAARPGSRVLRRAAEDARALLLQAGDRKLDIWDSTGPGCVTRALAKALLEEPEAAGALAVVTTLPHYHSFAMTRTEMVYKTSAAGNWRMA